MISLIDDYAKRLSRFCKFEHHELSIPSKWAKLPVEKRTEKEGELILSSLDSRDSLILLDESGRQFRSLEFAAQIEQYALQGESSLVYCIGGANGFSQTIYSAAKAKMALSKMTFTHQMVRLFFVEQLYRAFSINQNLPYHNE